MLRLIRKFLQLLFSTNTCAECGKMITEETSVSRNSDTDVCAHCYADAMMRADAYELYYTDR